MAVSSDPNGANALARDRVLATLSHEIRTPLNGVLGMAGLLASTRLDETQKAYLDALRACGDHLLNLVNDALDLAKLDSGRVALEPAPTDLAALLQGVAELLSPRAYASGVEIAWWVAPDVPIVSADDGRLRQILFNLAGNALKFAEEGGAVLSAETIVRKEDRVRIRFAVADTGPGLAPADQAAVFHPFVQTETGARAGGAGLGLAIVQRLAEVLGGEVGVESAPGQGAVFWFEAEFPSLHSRSVPPRPLAGLKIGVASPSPIVREAAARQIEACGALAVLSATRKGLPSGLDLVLIDGALRRARPPQGVPALILLAPEERRRIAAAKSAGFSGYLVKPLRRESVAGRILAVLTGPPAPAAAERATEDERAVPASAPGARVLLVEDNPVNALLAQALLGREGCSVDRAATGAEALEAAAHAPYDLILMDVRLPDMDGLAAARAIRARDVATPIVALTANSFEEDRHACLAAGMDDFLTKPLSAAALRAALHRWARVEPRAQAVPPRAAVL